MTTDKTNSTEYEDPFGTVPSGPLGEKVGSRSLDEMDLYGNKTYKGHVYIFNTLTIKEIKEINKGWALKRLNSENFGDLIDEKLAYIDKETNLLIIEYQEEDMSDTSSSDDKISEQISEFQVLGELDKFKVKFLDNDMLAKLESNNNISYIDYKKLCSASNFSSVGELDASPAVPSKELDNSIPNNVAYSIIDKESYTWLDLVLNSINMILEDEDLLGFFAIICFPFMMVFIFYILYENRKKK